MPVELTIVTPDRQVFAGTVDNVVLPGAEGDFGVLENHERFLAPLRIGETRIENGGRVQWAAITDGFAQVNGEKVVVLVDAGELADDIDLDRAKAAKERAEREIRDVEAGADESDRLDLYEGALKRAITRIGVAGKS
jgi:F-type H+-transporting ATPase subunit epsilon